MRISKMRWIFGLAAVAGLTVSTVGCKSGFSVPGSSWLGMNKKTPPTSTTASSSTAPPSVSFAPNSSTTPPTRALTGAPTAGARTAGGRSITPTTTPGYPSMAQPQDSFTAPQGGSGYYTGDYRTNPQAANPQAQGFAPAATANANGGGVQRGFYSQDYNQQQAAGQSSQYANPSTSNPYAATNATNNPYVANNATADLRNAGSYGGASYSSGGPVGPAPGANPAGWNSQQNWQSNNGAPNSTWNSGPAAPTYYNSPSPGGSTYPANGAPGYSDPYQGTQSSAPSGATQPEPNARMANAYSSGIPDANGIPSGLSGSSAGYRPGSTARSVNPTQLPSYGNGEVQQAGFDSGEQPRTANLTPSEYSSTPGQSPSFDGDSGNWQQPSGNGYPQPGAAPPADSYPPSYPSSTWR